MAKEAFNFKSMFEEHAENSIISNLIRSRSYDQAESLLKKRLKRSIHDEKAYALLTALYQEKGCYRKALKTACDLLRVNPKNFFPYYYLATIYIHADINKAEDHIKKAISLDPKNEMLTSFYLELLYLLQDKDKAKALADSVKHKDASGEVMKTIVSNENDLDKRVQLLRDMLKNDPGDDDLIVQLIRVHYYRYEYKQAYRLIDSLLKKDPGSLLYRMMHKSLKYANKWWYMPKAWFSSTHERMETPGASIGVYFIMLLLIMTVSMWFFSMDTGTNISAVFVLVSLAYLGGIDYIVGVQRW